MKITVQAKHIAAGRPGEVAACPIALAMKEAGCTRPRVQNVDCTFLDKDGIKRQVMLPPIAQTFIAFFDFFPADERNLRPFSFEIQP